LIAKASFADEATARNRLGLKVESGDRDDVLDRVIPPNGGKNVEAFGPSNGETATFSGKNGLFFGTSVYHKGNSADF
jgi:hypothetical protein